MNQLMTTRSAELYRALQGNGGKPLALPAPSPSAPPDRVSSRSSGANKVYKSGPLFLSSKGIGWTSWKKKWFILTPTSLVFFRSDPSVGPQKGEVNLTLGGIDLNSSGSVVVKADKKLLTVLFPDGRTFTLKAETSEDLLDWKIALEEALAHAPGAAPVTGQNGKFKNDCPDAADVSLEQLRDRQPAKSLVIGQPILLALEDIDGTPSFLEKGLRFIEKHGVKVEGILRQAAAVDDVECRVREYEQGKCDFSPEEDPHVIADCVKYVLRELPSSPVPASCCNALIQACRTDRAMRVTAVRSAICDTFPEPNRRLLQRILMMMQTVASHKAENRMSSSAVAACMAPLLLRPLLAGECELENDFDLGDDGSLQLLQAAAAANHAQAIVITLLEEYEKIFGEDLLPPEPYSDSEYSGSESEELTDDDENFEDDEDEDAMADTDADVDESFAHTSKGTGSDVGDTGNHDLYNDKEKKKHPTGMPIEDAGEFHRLKAAETNLQNRAAMEPEGSEILVESVETRKKALHDRRLALEQDVAGLQEQLQKERELREMLDAGLEISQELLSSYTTDEKIKAELKELAEAEAEFNSLKQKADDLRLQLNQQREQNYSFMHDSCSQPQQSPNHHAELKDKGEDIEFTSSWISERSKSKDNHQDKSRGGRDIKCETSSLLNKYPSQIRQHEAVCNDGVLSSALEPTIDRHALNNSKRFGASFEAGNTTSSVMSKLTTRLNFLKERRTQISNELQNLDKGQSLGTRSQSHKSLINLDKFEGLGGGQTSERSIGFGKCHSLQNLESWAATDGQSVQHMERIKKSDGQSIQKQDKGQSSVPPRTFSR